MMENFDFNKISKKWQKKWAEAKIFSVTENPKKKKYYVLEMFPYPSGSGLHMGHAFNYVIGDIYTRFKRMNGFNVLYPMGYDSFGLPAENAAIKAKKTPQEFTEKSISHFIEQQKSLGLSYDWDRMVSTCQPDYYKWNQYFFLKFLEKGLVYRKEAPVNWCPECNTVLANEQVHDGKCWRHTKTEVEKKFLEQWFIKTTEYAEELLENIPKLGWPERIKIMQENWIGKSKGVNIFFKIENSDKILETYTTRCDTIFSVTFIVIAPESPLVMELCKGTSQETEVKKVVEEISKQTEIERTTPEGKDKIGAFLGKYAINPANGEKVPIYVANFALMYGTGIVMADAHDQRDFEFAKKYGIPLKFVISQDGSPIDPEKSTHAYVEDGILYDSGEFSGMDNKKALPLMANWLEKKKWGKKTTNYKLKDWLVSRQRYWGTPIPVVYCKKCGIVPVPEKELPVKLPEKVKFGIGNPLATSKEFVNTKCPKCKAGAKRETDTMDTFFDSSWYFLRYTDPKNNKEPFKKKNADYWMPVDQYIGGAEHACMHLIYARFFTKALRDMKFVKVDEPFKRLFNQGMLHGEDGHVMSKSRGNTVLPETVSEKYGIDTARFFLVSIASPDKDLEWSATGVEGSSRFMKKVMNYFETVKIGKSSKKVESKLHKAIRGVTEDIENFKYNLAVIKIRELFDSFEQEISKDTLESFLKLFHPFCPHVTEELWEKIGNKDFISLAKWPKFNAKKIDETAEQKEEAIHQILSDIRQVQELTGKSELKKITFITAAEWKYKFFKELKKQMEKTRNVGDILKILMATDLKKYGGEISKMVPKLIKNPARIPKVILNQKEEIKNMKDAEKDISEQFKAKLEIILEEKSKEGKAKQAMPGKPAILVD